MMIWVWFLKPVLFAGVFTLFAVYLRRQHPGTSARPALRGLLAALARAVLGVAFAFLLAALELPGTSPRLAWGLFFSGGFLLWLLVTAVAFRGVPFWKVLAFAASGELWGGVVDYFAIVDANSIRIC